MNVCRLLSNDCKGYFYRCGYKPGREDSMKKVVIFNGSPRYDGNTSTILQYIERGAKEHNANVKVYNLFILKASACRGCFACRVDDLGKCSIDDDLTKAMKEMEDADAVVIGTPVYFMQMNGMTKNLYDRFFPLITNEGKPRFGEKKIVTVYTQAQDDPKMFETYFDFVSATLLPNFGFVDEHRIVCPHANNPQTAEDNRDLMNEAYELGRRLALDE